MTESATDPDCGVFHKSEHIKCFAYGAHTVCDQNNFVLDVVVTGGNHHDRQVFDALYKKVTGRYPQIRVITADAGYKTPWICKTIFDDGRIPSLPYKRPMTKPNYHKSYEYVYDEYNDWVICPENQTLYYATMNRHGYQEYKSIPFNCERCPTRHLYTQNKSCEKTVTRYVWQDYLEMAEDIRHSPIEKATYALRSQTIERVFADAKEKHAMRYTLYRDLNSVSSWVRLK